MSAALAAEGQHVPNPDGAIVLYALNAGSTSQALRIGFNGKTAATVLPAGSVATFVWRL